MWITMVRESRKRNGGLGMYCLLFAVFLAKNCSIRCGVTSSEIFSNTWFTIILSSLKWCHGASFLFDEIILQTDIFYRIFQIKLKENISEGKCYLQLFQISIKWIVVGFGVMFYFVCFDSAGLILSKLLNQTTRRIFRGYGKITRLSIRRRGLLKSSIALGLLHR